MPSEVPVVLQRGGRAPAWMRYLSGIRLWSAMIGLWVTGRNGWTMPELRRSMTLLSMRLLG